jgi:hypothetical protein
MNNEEIEEFRIIIKELVEEEVEKRLTAFWLKFVDFLNREVF